MHFYVYSDHSASDPLDADDAKYLKGFQAKKESGQVVGHAFVRDAQPTSLATVLETFLTDLDEVSERDRVMETISAAASGSVDAVHLGDDDNYLISSVDLGRHKVLAHATVFRNHPFDRQDYTPFSGSDIEARLRASPMAFLVTPDDHGFRYTMVQGAVAGASAILDKKVAGTTYDVLEVLAEKGVLVDEITAAVGEGWQEDLEAARHRFTMLAG